jgi:hypothetical protein
LRGMTIVMHTICHLTGFIVKLILLQYSATDEGNILDCITQGRSWAHVGNPGPDVASANNRIEV